ncbi:maltose ABC transporter substrate-binding protein [Mycetocola lacteus]|uniref:Maltose ABC transporter substrate-binding protein n=1 Tax=Mycetocola lacteus TaxID=76637 RepID=A0A3L7ATG0_9MICO|nr:maltose ABC transporter substrate-binding protein [Mycetocola lacteus]RLP83809.1 maltose ABC transporter substrate-binding protein [Mycetocola lacteus]
MKVTKKRVLLTGAALTALALGLSGCSASTESSDAGSSKNTLTVWVDADRAPVLKEAAAEFEKSSGVHVKLVQKDFGSILDQFIAQVPSGKGPDITIGAHDWIGNFVQNGVIQPVELGDKAAGFEKIATDAITYQGKTYAVPYSIENIALLRNTALAPTAPTTYDEMVAMGKAAGSANPFLVQLGPQADPYHLYPFQSSFDNPVFGRNADGSYNADDLTIGNEGGTKYANWLAEQGKAGNLNISITADIAKEKFNSGQSPFMITGPWNVPDAEKAGIKLAVDPIPSAGGAPAQPFVGVQGFFISSKTANPLAANEFLTNYLATQKVQTALFEKGGRAPALKASFDAASSNPIVKAFGDVGRNGVPMPSVPAMGKVWQFWGVTEAAIISGEGDPSTLWTKMTADIAAAIKG